MLLSDLKDTQCLPLGNTESQALLFIYDKAPEGTLHFRGP